MWRCSTEPGIVVRAPRTTGGADAELGERVWSVCAVRLAEVSAPLPVALPQCQIPLRALLQSLANGPDEFGQCATGDEQYPELLEGRRGHHRCADQTNQNSIDG